jgi:peptide/nickel transport system permease protein
VTSPTVPHPAVAAELDPGPVAAPAARTARFRRTAPSPRLVRGGDGRWALRVGLVLLGVLAAAAVAGPWMIDIDPNEQDVANALARSSGDHLLGTDHLGRDVLSRLLHAARLDLLVGVTAVIAPFVTGTALGLLAGYFRGIVGGVIMRLADVVMAFPYYVLVIALVFAMGPGTKGMYLAVALVVWSSYARIIYGEVLAIAQTDYVRAARSAGLGHLRVMVRHILPNAVSPALVYATSDIVVIILGVVTLSYLGLGVPPPTAEWGSMISEARPFIQTHPNLLVAPGIAVILTGTAFSLIGDGLAHRLRVGSRP